MKTVDKILTLLHDEDGIITVNDDKAIEIRKDGEDSIIFIIKRKPYNRIKDKIESFTLTITKEE